MKSSMLAYLDPAVEHFANGAGIFLRKSQPSTLYVDFVVLVAL